MNDFKWRHYQGEIILHCVRWYCRYGISYRDLEEMMEERGLSVDHTTLYRWVIHYAPKLTKRLRWYAKTVCNRIWQADETYIKVKGVWKYLYRAIDQTGRTIDFYLSHTRNAKAAQAFLSKALKRFKWNDQPQVINTDRSPTYGVAIAKLKESQTCQPNLIHRQVKYKNNRIESDHGKLKQLIKPVRGFKTMKSAYATIKGFEVMRMFRKGQFKIWSNQLGVMGEIQLIHRQFGLYAA